MVDKEYIERGGLVSVLERPLRSKKFRKYEPACRAIEAFIQFLNSAPVADVAPRGEVAREICDALVEYAYTDSNGDFCVPVAVVKAMADKYSVKREE